MAFIAGNVHVSALEHEARLDVVIKEPEIPGDRVMARVTVVGENAIVVVVLNVAADTRLIRIDIDLGFMAIDAFNISVLAEQWKARQVMIEKWCVLPEDFVMAVAALISLCSFMRVIIKMTG